MRFLLNLLIVYYSKHGIQHCLISSFSLWMMLDISCSCLHMFFCCLKQKQRGFPPSNEKEMACVSGEDAISDVMEQHAQFVRSMQSRSAKLQVIQISVESGYCVSYHIITR